MEKKAIFLDIDGTYTCGSPVPPKRNVEAIKAARALGHMVFINTGRSFGFIPKEVFESTEFDGIVAGGGAYVQLGNQVLQKQRMSRGALKKITAHFIPQKAICMFEGEKENLYLNEPNPASDWLEIKSPEDFDTIYKNIPITKVTIMGQLDQESLQILSDAGMRVIQFPRYAESILNGCSKAGGMEIILKATGISRENSVAMGDSLNDMEMIEYAGISVAMGNAIDELKEKADIISSHAGDGGVGEVIEKYFLTA